MRTGDTAGLGLPAEDYRQQRATYEATLLGIAADLPNVTYWPVFVDLCDEQFCPLFDGETLLFRDGDHLSWEGALKLTHEARELLQSVPNTNRE